MKRTNLASGCCSSTKTVGCSVRTLLCAWWPQQDDEAFKAFPQPGCLFGTLLAMGKPQSSHGARERSVPLWACCRWQGQIRNSRVTLIFWFSIWYVLLSVDQTEVTSISSNRVAKCREIVYSSEVLISKMWRGVIEWRPWQLLMFEVRCLPVAKHD